MYSKYPLFHSHLDLAHQCWKMLLKPGETAIDATCGNGHDTLMLAKLALTDHSGKLYAIDLQSAAIESCCKLLHTKLPKNLVEKVHFYESCHSKFPEEILPNSVKLIVYNLGYLPGSDKKLTTFADTTLQSIQEALRLIQDGGLISITCYPGHPAGKEEEQEIVQFVSTLDTQTWSCCHHRWTNRNNAPSLLLIQKSCRGEK